MIQNRRIRLTILNKVLYCIYIIMTERKYKLDDLPNEIRVDIKWYEWSYMISNKWRAKSLSRITAKWSNVKSKILRYLNKHKNKSVVFLGKKWFRVARLVMSHFWWVWINDMKDHIVDHIDRDNSNNCISNLKLIHKHIWIKTAAKGYIKLKNVSDATRSIQSADARKYVRSAPEKHRAYNLDYYSRRKDEVLKRSKVYYAENKEKVLERMRTHYAENRENVCERNRMSYAKKTKSLVDIRYKRKHVDSDNLK